MALSKILENSITDGVISAAKLKDFAAAVDLNGVELILDADQDTSITADTDDQIDIKISGADDFRFTANTFTALAGSGIVVPDGGLTFGSTAISATAAEINLIDGGASTGTTAVADADGIITNDGGTMRLTTAATFKTYFQEGISTAYDDLTTGDAAVNIATSAGNITIDAQGNDTDIIFKGTDGGADKTFMTIDGSAGGDLFLTGGLIDLKNDGSAVSQIKFYCESSNAHAQTLIGAPHSESATNTLTLPSTGGNSYLLTAASTATLTNKTLTSPVINTGTFGTSILPVSADGTTLGSASKEFSDLFLADGGQILFGEDQEITLTHEHNTGLIIKHNGTGDGAEPSLTFQAGDTDIAANDVLGSIFFQAPGEGAGTDAILIAAGIEAVSEGDFSASNNATKLSFKTAASELASEKMSLSSAGVLTVSGGVVGDVTGDVTGTADVATVATTVTITDNESTNESNALIFTAGGDVDGGNIGLESDGTLTYNPSTGKVTATGFVGTLTGAVTGNVAGNLTGTVATATQNSITTATGLVSVGALDSGSITSGFGAIDNGTSNIRSATITAETAFVPDANDGADLGTTSLGFNDLFLADSGTIQFGNDQDVTLTHVADTGLILSVAGNGDTLSLISTDADANVGPVHRLYRNSASPADDDLIGSIKFTGRNDNSQDVEYGSIFAQIKDASDTTEDSTVTFTSFVNGTAYDRMHFNPDQTVFNEAGIDLDFRVESNDVANMIKLDGANNNVGIGATAPSATAFTVKPASGNPAFTVQNTADGPRLAGSVWAGAGSISSEASQAGFASLLHVNTNTQSEIRIDSTTDSFRGGASGTYWVVISIGDQSTIGGGWLSVLKPQNGNWVMYWDQVISSGTNPTISLTSTTVNTTVLDGHLRIANTNHSYATFSVTKMSGGGGNGGATPLFAVAAI